MAHEAEATGEEEMNKRIWTRHRKQAVLMAGVRLVLLVTVLWGVVSLSRWLRVHGDGSIMRLNLEGR